MVQCQSDDFGVCYLSTYLGHKDTPELEDPRVILFNLGGGGILVTSQAAFEVFRGDDSITRALDGSNRTFSPIR